MLRVLLHPDLATAINFGWRRELRLRQQTAAGWTDLRWRRTEMVAGRQVAVEVATSAPGTMRKANAESVSVIRKEADMNRYSGLSSKICTPIPGL